MCDTNGRGVCLFAFAFVLCLYVYRRIRYLRLRMGKKTHPSALSGRARVLDDCITYNDYTPPGTTASKLIAI